MRSPSRFSPRLKPWPPTVRRTSPWRPRSIKIPDGVVPGFGGLHIELASTALAGLGEGARYLVEYPYGCAEQRGSRTLALVLAGDLGQAFNLPGIDHARMRPAAQQSLRELEKFQCSNGGFAYWPGDCHYTSPYLTSYLLHVFKTAIDLKYEVTPSVMRDGYSYLEQRLASRRRRTRDGGRRTRPGRRSP